MSRGRGKSRRRKRRRHRCEDAERTRGGNYFSRSVTEDDAQELSGACRCEDSLQGERRKRTV